VREKPSASRLGQEGSRPEKVSHVLKREGGQCESAVPGESYTYERFLSACQPVSLWAVAAKLLDSIASVSVNLAYLLLET
jgi:hypothetical protein